MELFLSIFKVVAPINKLIESVPFNLTAYSLDWHPSDHLSFVDNVGKRKLHESSPVSHSLSLQRACFLEH